MKIVPDLNTYQDLWYMLQLYAAKPSAKNVAGPLKLIAKDLIKVFNVCKRWKQTDLTIHDAAAIASGLSMLKIGNEKFIADIGDIIRAKIKDAEGQDLILLTRGSFYMRDF